MKNRTKSPIILLIALALGAFGCDSFYELPEAEYLIKKGKHQSNIKGSLPRNGQRALKSEALYFTARFDESAIYIIDERDQYDVNKLFGFADCSSDHHKNSARFGWNFNPETRQVDIFSYVYKDGDRMIERLGSTNINETLTYRLSLEGGKFVFEFKDTIVKVERGNTCDKGLYYLLYPYFGGNQEAPHDISIYIKELL